MSFIHRIHPFSAWSKQRQSQPVFPSRYTGNSHRIIQEVSLLSFLLPSSFLPQCKYRTQPVSPSAVQAIHSIR